MKHDATVSLEKLGAELDASGYETKLITPENADPWLSVRNPQAPQLNERVKAGAERFLWSWGDSIAPVSDIADAAGKVGRVLRAVDSR